MQTPALTQPAANTRCSSARCPAHVLLLAMQERSRQFEPMRFTDVDRVTVDIEGAGSVRLRVSGTPDGFYARMLVGWPEVPEYVTGVGWETVGEPPHSIFLDIHLSDVRMAPEAVEWLLTSDVLQDAAAAARELAMRQGSAELGAKEMFKALTSD